MKFHLVLFVLLFMIILSAGCDGPDDNGKPLTPVMTPRPTSTPADRWIEIPPAVLIQKGESREALTRAADDLQRGDTSWLVDAMPPEVQEQLDGRPAISSADAAEISRALREAREVEMHENLMIYETTYRGAPHTFYAVKEWSTWKIVGF